MTGQVYKILSRESWLTAMGQGTVAFQGVDEKDGFVHLCTADQLGETLRVHFAGQENLVVLAFDTDDLGAALRWEVSRGGQKFPHFYGRLETRQVRAQYDVSADPAGFILPQALTKRSA